MGGGLEGNGVVPEEPAEMSCELLKEEAGIQLKRAITYAYAM